MIDRVLTVQSRGDHQGELPHPDRGGQGVKPNAHQNA
jgi:hypothetical protein